MTAFSRTQSDLDWGSLTWELRSVNHRYLETSIRIPDLFRSIEPGVREAIRSKLSRGKLECQLRYQINEKQQSELNLNTDLLNKLVSAQASVRALSDDAAPLSSNEILRWPGILIEEEQDTDSIEAQALSLFVAALDQLTESREREGADLDVMIRQRVDSIKTIVKDVRQNMPDILLRQKQNLQNRVAEMTVELDPDRLEQETAILLQKADVDEELDRLDSHLKEVERVLGMKGQKGRRLDFLMQELNREANTLSSKSVIAETTLNAVELKVLIEQMREQIQNIE